MSRSGKHATGDVGGSVISSKAGSGTITRTPARRDRSELVRVADELDEAGLWHFVGSGVRPSDE